jgi:VWFA-related protein
VTATGLALLFGGALALNAASPQPPPQQPSFPAQAEGVTVDVVVTDRGGTPVLDLKREDFAVSEDGVAQEIVAFDAVHRPAPEAAGTPPPAALQPRATSNHDAAAREAASFVIVFDELHLDVAEAAHGRQAVADFLKAGVADGDRVGVVGTAEGVRWTAAMPEGRDALLKAVGRFDLTVVLPYAFQGDAGRSDHLVLGEVPQS